MSVATRDYGLFVNGETVEASTGGLRELREPATGEVLARAAMAGEADVDRAVDAARATRDGAWGKTPGPERSNAKRPRLNGFSTSGSTTNCRAEHGDRRVMGSPARRGVPGAVALRG